MNVRFRLMPCAAMMIMTLGCEGAPETALPALPDPVTLEVSSAGPQTCEAACQIVVSCLRGHHGNYGGGYAQCGQDSSPDWCGYGGYGDGYGGYGNLPGYGDGSGYGSGGYGSGYGSCGGGYAQCGQDSSPDWCGYGGYGDGYGGYGNLPGYGDGGGYGSGYGDGYGSGYGSGYGDGYGSGYGGGYGSCGGGYAQCGQDSSPDWCGYGGYGDGYGGYGNLPGYGGYGSGYGCGNGGTMLSQCIAGCRALPHRLQKHLVNCVTSSHSCKARLACE